jgi:hypothetical protein
MVVLHQAIGVYFLIINKFLIYFSEPIMNFAFDSANGSLILEKTQGFNIHLSFRFNL